MIPFKTITRTQGRRSSVADHFLHQLLHLTTTLGHLGSPPESVSLEASTGQAVPAHEAAYGFVRDAHPLGHGALGEALIEQDLDLSRGLPA